jgi:hypothetical protein
LRDVTALYDVLSVVCNGDGSSIAREDLLEAFIGRLAIFGAQPISR